jgi:hypothetical protein
MSNPYFCPDWIKGFGRIFKGQNITKPLSIGTKIIEKFSNQFLTFIEFIIFSNNYKFFLGILPVNVVTFWIPDCGIFKINISCSFNLAGPIGQVIHYRSSLFPLREKAALEMQPQKILSMPSKNFILNFIHFSRFDYLII